MNEPTQNGTNESEPTLNSDQSNILFEQSKLLDLRSTEYYQHRLQIHDTIHKQLINLKQEKEPKIPNQITTSLSDKNDTEQKDSKDNDTNNNITEVTNDTDNKSEKKQKQNKKSSNSYASTITSSLP
eukprot:870970_1